MEKRSKFLLDNGFPKSQKQSGSDTPCCRVRDSDFGFGLDLDEEKMVDVQSTILTHISEKRRNRERNGGNAF